MEVSNLTIPVTVIAVCYNHERFIIECLESIRSQTYKNFEFVIVDDKSTDTSPKLIRAWIEAYYPDAKFICHEENVGLCKSLNEALSVSSGQFVSLIATDDVWEPNKIELQLALISAQPDDVAMIYSDAYQIDESSNLIDGTFLGVHLKGNSAPSGSIFTDLADGNFIPAMAATIRRKSISEVGGYDETLTYEDYDMWLRLASRFKIIYLDQVVARYRIVSTSMIRTLWVKPTARHSLSVFKIHLKWVRSAVLTPIQRKRWSENIGSAAYNLYLIEDAQASKCLWTSFFLRPKVKVLLLAITSSLGISRNRAKQIASVLKRQS